MAGDLQGLMQVVRQGQALAFSAANIGDVFNQKFPGHKSNVNFPTEYKNWSSTVRDTLRGALEAAGLQASQFATEEQAMAQMRSMAQSTSGRMQAIQVGNQIAAENAAQTQKLRALVMAQMQSQNAYMMGQQQEKDAVRGAVDSMFTGGSVKTGRQYSTALGGSK